MARRYTVDEVISELMDVVDEDDSEDEFDGYVQDVDEGGNEGGSDGEDGEDGEDGGGDSGASVGDAGVVGGVNGVPDYSGQPGCVLDMSNKEPFDFFNLLVSDSMLDTICQQTVLYSEQYISSNDISRRSRVQQWIRHGHNVDELKKFLACVIVMGVINYPAMEDWWCTSWPYATRSVSSILSRDRFSLILRFLHLNDNSQYIPKGQPGHDALFKLRPFLDPLLHNLKAMYTAHRDVSVDEQMIGFKGRLQYLPKEPTKWGMKAYVLADSHSGYVLKWKLYTGKNTSVNPNVCMNVCACAVYVYVCVRMCMYVYV